MEPMTPPRASAQLRPVGGHPHPIRAALAVSALLVAGLAAAYAVSESLDPVYEWPRRQYRQAVAAGPAVQALSLGNSHSRAIDFETLGLRGVPLGSPGNDFYEVRHILRSLRPHLANLEYVFIPVSLFVNDNSTDHERSDVRRMAYMTTGNYAPMEGDRAIAFQALLAPVVRADNWRGVGGAAYRMLRSKVSGGSRAAAQGGGRGVRRRNGVPSARQIQASAQHKATVHSTWQTLSMDRNPQLCEEARQALREIARLSAPARLVLYTPPYSPAYLAASEAHSGGVEGCHLDRFAAELAASSPGVEYYDDRAMAPFSDSSGLFRDADHVNRNGARAYSRVLAERLGLRHAGVPSPARSSSPSQASLPSPGS